jgi:hypothetical protein
MNTPKPSAGLPIPSREYTLLPDASFRSLRIAFTA